MKGLKSVKLDYHYIQDAQWSVIRFLGGANFTKVWNSFIERAWDMQTRNICDLWWSSPIDVQSNLFTVHDIALNWVIAWTKPIFRSGLILKCGLVVQTNSNRISWVFAAWVIEDLENTTL